jgi:hypothetical protein
MKMLFPGGLNENDGTLMEECQKGWNFELRYGDTDLRPRMPNDLKGTAPNLGSIRGQMQLIKKDDDETTLIFADDGVTPILYLWDGGSSWTSKRTTNLAVGSKLRDIHFVLDDTLSIVDVEKLTPLMKWDGDAVSRHKTGLAAGQPSAVTSITRFGTTATVVTTYGHGRATGDLVIHAGANETDYNVEAEITVTGANTYTFEVENSPATPATGTITWDAGVDLYAKYGVVHNGRLWLFNITTDDGTPVELPHMMVASAFEDIESFDTAKRAQDSGFSTGEEAFFMLSQDLRPINGVAVFNQNLIISTEDGRIYRLIGSDSTDYEWISYYGGSAATGTETMANIGNDVVFMKKGGNIDTIIATDTSGDVEADDISRWIPDTVRDLSDALTVYDQTNQKVFFFVTDKVLVLFKDALYGYGGKFSPWSIYKTELDARYNTNSARYLRRPDEKTYSVYWGDDSGNIYDINGGGFGDAGNTAIETSRRTKLIADMNPVQEIINGQVQYRRYGECNLVLDFEWSDDYNISQSVIPLQGPPDSDIAPYFGGETYWGGDWYFGQSFAFANKVSTRGFSPTGRSESFFLTASINTQVRYKVDNIDISA